MTPEIEVRAFPLRDVTLEGWDERIAGRWHYDDLASDPVWRHGWISFDAVTFNRRDGNIYCGLNSLDGDLLYRFDPATQAFTSLGTQAWTDAFDAKIHRTLLIDDRDGSFYFGTSLLHDANRQRSAPGGKLVRYDPHSSCYSVVAIPCKGQYLQSIALDNVRDIAYSFTYPSELLVRTDLRSGSSEVLAYVGNGTMLAQPHNAVIDRHGWLWGTYAETRAWDEVTGPEPIRLFKYHPDTDEFVWFTYGLPRKADRRQRCANPTNTTHDLADMTESRHKDDFGFCDAMLYDGGRHVYVGTVAGVLARIDVDTNQVEKIANVMESGRFPALSLGPDGRVYGAGGMRGACRLCRFDPTTDQLDVWSDLIEPKQGARPARIHELAIADDGTLWLGENDNHERSSYLWSVAIDTTLAGRNPHADT